MLTESDLLSALASDSPQPSSKSVEPPAARSASPVAESIPTLENPLGTPPDTNDAHPNFEAASDDRGPSTPENTPEPESPSELEDALVAENARVQAPGELPANAALTDDLFSAEELESAYAEVDAAAVSGQERAAEFSTLSGEDRVEQPAMGAETGAASDTPPVNSEIPSPSPPDSAGNGDQASSPQEPPGDSKSAVEPPPNEQPTAAGKGLKFSIGKKAASESAVVTESPPGSAGSGPAETTPEVGPIPETKAAAAEPHTRLSKRLIRAIEAGLDAIHKPFVSRMPGALKFVGIWSLCTIVVSLVVILGLPVLMARNDALSHLEHCLLSLSSDSPPAADDAEKVEAGESHGSEKPKKGGKAAKSNGKQSGDKKADHRAESKHGEEVTKKDDAHGAKKAPQDDKHGDGKSNAKDDGGHGAAKPTPEHGVKQKPKSKEKAKSKKDEKPKDAHGGGH